MLLLLVPLLVLLAFYSALGRVGFALPIPAVAARHGFLMVSGLFGTLISLERTLILPDRSWLGIPILSALAVVALLLDFDTTAFSLQLLAALLLTALYLKQAWQYREIYFGGLILSSLAWGMSALVLLLGGGFPVASIWYLLFLLFTIVAERLELSKFVAVPPWGRPLLMGLMIALILSQAIPFHWGSHYISGLLIAAIAYWLLRFDIVNINLRKQGFFYYVGSTLFGGYLWLLLCGILMALPLQAFYHYDAVLHSFFIGFAFSMLYAHAPIIFPALLRRRQRPFHPLLYIPVIATHLLLLLRLYCDYAAWWEGRKFTALLQVAAMLSFFVLMALLLTRTKNSEGEN